MKAFIVSVFLALSGLFGSNKQQQVVLHTPTLEPSPTVFVEESISPTLTPTKVTTAKPTITRPKSPINEEILKKFFGISDKNQALAILSDKAQLQKYEHEFYRKFLSYPIPRVAISSNNQLIAMPSMNGFTICTGEQLKKLYAEISAEEKQAEYEKMNYDCHHNPSKQETTECQEWRRVNDINRVEPTKGSLDDQIAAYQKKIEDYANKKNVYDNLLVKYCQN